MSLYAKASAYRQPKRDLEKKLDRIFSEYIRLRDADDNGCCKCITCGKWHFWKDIHCGHFISRSVKAVRYNEMNCNAQCVHCNSFRQGEWLKYEQALIRIYGKDAVEELKMAAEMGGNYDSFWLQEKIIEYGEKVKQLKNEKGL